MRPGTIKFLVSVAASAVALTGCASSVVMVPPVTALAYQAVAAPADQPVSNPLWTFGGTAAYLAVSPAMTVAQQLKAAFRGDIDQVLDVTVVTDIDGLLGLPGLYTSKATFHDATLNTWGYVEVYSTSLDRGTRASGIDRTQETDFQLGTVFVRLMLPDLDLTQKGSQYNRAVSDLVLP